MAVTKKHQKHRKEKKSAPKFKILVGHASAMKQTGRHLLCCQTDPLQLGSLYNVHCNASLSRQKTLRAPLLSYLISYGWTKPSSFNHLMREATP